MQAENDKGEHISQPLRYLIRFIQAKHGSAKSMENPWEAIDMQLGIDGWPADREKKWMHFVEHHGYEDCRFFHFLMMGFEWLIEWFWRFFHKNEVDHAVDQKKCPTNVSYWDTSFWKCCINLCFYHFFGLGLNTKKWRTMKNWNCGSGDLLKK